MPAPKKVDREINVVRTAMKRWPPKSFASLKNKLLYLLYRAEEGDKVSSAERALSLFLFNQISDRIRDMLAMSAIQKRVVNGATMRREIESLEKAIAALLKSIDATNAETNYFLKTYDYGPTFALHELKRSLNKASDLCLDAKQQLKNGKRVGAPSTISTLAMLNEIGKIFEEFNGMDRDLSTANNIQQGAYRNEKILFLKAVFDAAQIKIAPSTYKKVSVGPLKKPSIKKK
jgi:hypothetical protein